jgi:hypothetical protein
MYPLPIAVAPGARPVAEIRFSYPDTAKVIVLDRRGDHAYVVVDAWNPAALFGWIPSAALAPPPGRLVGGHHVRAPTIRQMVADDRPRRRVVCDADVPITAELEGRHAVFASVAAGKPFTYLVEERTDRTHDAFVAGISAQKNANVVVASADVASCKDAP